MRDPLTISRALDDLARFLEGYEHPYAGRLRSYSARLTNKEALETSSPRLDRAYDELWHHAFGAMGSLTDVVITQRNGHNVKVEDEPDINRQYWVLLARLQELLKDGPHDTRAT